MGRRRRKPEELRRTVGWRVSPDAYDKVSTLCRDMRFKKKPWKKGDFAEAGLRILFAFSAQAQRAFVDNIDNPAFWDAFAEEVRKREPALLEFLSAE